MHIIGIIINVIIILLYLNQIRAHFQHFVPHESNSSRLLVLATGLWGCLIWTGRITKTCNPPSSRIVFGSYCLVVCHYVFLQKIILKNKKYKENINNSCSFFLKEVKQIEKVTKWHFGEWESSSPNQLKNPIASPFVSITSSSFYLLSPPFFSSSRSFPLQSLPD